jgi:hypothetical protein
LRRGRGEGARDREVGSDLKERVRGLWLRRSRGMWLDCGGRVK